ncbi:hypothetical protein HUJ05_007858 [Dendroctonus ponderosae]|nr:hypothetical protein HUJ05_007858 [Dendroctonus ponderosae]
MAFYTSQISSFWRNLGGCSEINKEFYTILIQIEATFNFRPLTPMTSDPNNLQAITPSHFLIGQALSAIPEGSLFNTTINTGTIMANRIPKNAGISSDNDLKKKKRGSYDQLVRDDGKISLKIKEKMTWSLKQKMMNNPEASEEVYNLFLIKDRLFQSFWNRWNLEYFHSLQERSKWKFKKNNPSLLGSLVLLKEEAVQPLHWPMARIIAVYGVLVTTVQCE